MRKLLFLLICLQPFTVFAQSGACDSAKTIPQLKGQIRSQMSTRFRWEEIDVNGRSAVVMIEEGKLWKYLALSNIQQIEVRDDGIKCSVLVSTPKNSTTLNYLVVPYSSRINTVVLGKAQKGMRDVVLDAVAYANSLR